MTTAFAGYEWQIRDTRENERKSRAFVRGGTVTVFPRGILNGYGTIEPTVPWPATAEVVASTSVRFVIEDGAADPAGTHPFTGIPVVPHDLIYTDAMVQATEPEQAVVNGTMRYVWPNIDILWRPAAGGEWRVLEDSVSGLGLNIRPPIEAMDALVVAVDDDPPAVFRPVQGIAYVHHNNLTGDDSDYPSHGQAVQVMVVYGGPPTRTAPFHLEGMTAGELVRDLYDGLYSPRDLDGNVRPTGIRYDLDAVLALDTPVRLRITEPVDNVREWVEEHIYRPLGYSPALDFDGRISPVSQEAPDPDDPYDGGGLTNISDAITAPVPDWDAGERIINHVLFRYPRDYLDPDTDALDLISSRPVEVSYLDPDSIEIHSQRTLEIDGSAFRAVGGLGGTQAEVQEWGAWLASVRGLLVLDRYAWGAQAIRLPVMRVPTAHLRAGSWITVDLSWFPGYDIRRRHMITMGQIVAVKDLDCAWREILFEEAFPVETPLPPPPAAPTLTATLMPPEHQSSIVTLTIAASEDNASLDWQVSAVVSVRENGTGEPDVTDHGDITAQLDPVPGTITEAATVHTWDAEWIQGGATTFEGDDLVTVTMTVRIKDGSTTVAETTAPAAYWSDGTGS